MTDEREDEHTKDDVTVMQDQTDTVKLEPGGVVKSVDDLDFRERAKLLPDHDTWLERPSTVRGLIIASLVVLAFSVVVEPIFIPASDYEAHFPGLDNWPFRIGWHAMFGLGACVVMVVFSKWVVGNVLKRSDSYYRDLKDRTPEDPSPGPTEDRPRGGDA